jgi:hypothetical protein
VPCVKGKQPVANLYLMDGDGPNVRRIIFDQDAGWHPSVMGNGRVMYTRWEYTDSSHYFSRVLMAPHNPNGPCSLAASLQIAACIPNFLVQERGDIEHELLAKPLSPVKDGYRPIATAPGLGITLDEDKLMAQVGEPRRYRPRFDQDDGSVVDW